MNSKRKGNAGERELAGILKEHGYKSRRGLQYQGGQVEADVVGIPGIHIECKRVEKLNLYNAMEQSIRDAKEYEIPVVMHRKNRQPWEVTMRTCDLLKMCEAEYTDFPGLVTMELEDWLIIERRTL